MPQDFTWQVNIGSGKGLVTSGNKPLPEFMITQMNLPLGHNDSYGK